MLKHERTFLEKMSECKCIIIFFSTILFLTPKVNGQNTELSLNLAYCNTNNPISLSEPIVIVEPGGLPFADDNNYDEYRIDVYQNTTLIGQYPRNSSNQQESWHAVTSPYILFGEDYNISVFAKKAGESSFTPSSKTCNVEFLPKINVNNAYCNNPNAVYNLSDKIVIIDPYGSPFADDIIHYEYGLSINSSAPIPLNSSNSGTTWDQLSGNPINAGNCYNITTYMRYTTSSAWIKSAIDNCEYCFECSSINNIPDNTGCENNVYIEVRKVDEPTCGDCDGQIIFENPKISTGATFTWSHDSSETGDNVGSLCSGLYTITVTENGNSRATQVIIN